jgi:polar amino acid transport system substrate-binding protein
MLRKKIGLVFLLACVLVCGAFFSGCSGSSNSKVLKIGVDDSYPPMEYKDDKNNTVGFDMDLASEIAKKLGMKVELVSTAWDGIFQALNTDKFDCIISSVSLTEERLSNFAFTRPYIANAQVIVVPPANSTIKDGKDLAGKKVGVQVSTTAHDSAKKLLENIKFTLNTYDQVIQPFQDLKTGRIEAVIVDEVVARYYVTQDKASYKVSSGKLTNEPIAVCFKKDNTALRDKVDKVIEGFQKDGTLKKISEKWFSEDLTGNIDEKLKM